MPKIKEFHLFAGIGGGIYGGKLLGHTCCAGVEIDKYCKSVLRQRQEDGWMEHFPIYDDITVLNGEQFKGKFDILCGGFPCQAFSQAAHGNNKEEKNLWPDMFRFVQESEAPIVFGENVTREAIEMACNDLLSIGYEVQYCKLACEYLGADHLRPRYWLVAIRNRDKVFTKVAKHLQKMEKLQANCWLESPRNIVYPAPIPAQAPQLKAVGNAQSPFAAATAFRLLFNRHLNPQKYKVIPKSEEIEAVFNKQSTWIKNNYGVDCIVHTPTTMGNYHYASMQKHPVCRNYVMVFGKPNCVDAEYLMGFPIGASSAYPCPQNNIEVWNVRNL